MAADLTFDRWHRHDDLTALLQGWASAHPDLVEVTSAGRSFEGRDIWLATVTNTATGPAAEKPALWVDGGIHATELAGTAAALHLVHHLVTRYGEDERVTRALDTRAFYVLPRINPDGAELALADRPRFLRSSTRPWPIVDPLDGLVPEDVDGDGRILSMRVPDPNGSWRAHPDEPRLLVHVDPVDPPGPGEPRWRLFQEGTVRNYDGVMVPLAGNAEALDLNRNFPHGWRPEADQRGAGPFPTSEPEVRAVVQAMVDRPNITGYIDYHTYSGVHLRPYSGQPDDDLPVNDLRTFKAIGRQATSMTGYPAVSVYHDFRYHPKEVITGGSDDWVYDHLGIYAWTTEIWSPQRAAGLEVKGFIDWFVEHPVEDELHLLRWSDEALGGEGYVDWYPFEHPQLGPVELGGWHSMRWWRNPPLERLEAEIAPHSDFAVWHCLISPLLAFRSVDVEAMGEDQWSVRVVVENTGWLPTNVTDRAVERKVVQPLVVTVDVPEGGELVSGERRVECGQLSGRNLLGPSLTLMPVNDVTSDRAKVEWVVRAPAGSSLQVTARHHRGGTVRADVALGG